MLELIKKTSAYKAILGDKAQNTLSHAYLIDCNDEIMLREYLKVFAKLILCESEEICGSCRICRLIDKEAHPDVSFYPPIGEKLNSAMADDIVDKTIVKPFELNKRMFVICGFEGFDKNQNKLLKTLEEPPENVVLLIGTSNPSALLPTVKSRVKKLDIPNFSNEALFELLKNKYQDEEKLKSAIMFSDGKLGEVDEAYNNGNVLSLKSLCLDVLENLNTSRDEAKVAYMLKDVDINAFLSVLKLQLGELCRLKCTDEKTNIQETRLVQIGIKYTSGAIIEIIEKIAELEKRQHFNANRTMMIDKMLFTILEAKHKWQKLSV